MESLYLLFFVFFLIIVIFPFTFDIKICFDFLENHGSVALLLKKIKLKVAKIERKGTQIILITKKKNTTVKIALNEKQLRFLIFFQKEVGNKVKLRKMNVYSVVGGNEPFESALISGTFSAFVLGIFSKLKIWQPTADFSLKNKTSFFESKFSVGISFRVCLSIFDVIFSFLVSILRSKFDRKIDKELKII